MRKEYSYSSSIINLSRAQTAKMRKTLTKTLQTIKNKKSHTENNLTKRPITAYSYFSNRDKINSKYLITNENNNIRNNKTTRTLYSKYSRPNTSINIKKNNQSIKFFGKSGNLRSHSNDIKFRDLISEKLKEKKKNEKIEDYAKKLYYRKIIMRSKLLKAIKSNIILKQKQFEEFNEKYSTGNRLLSEKIKNRGKMIKNESSDDYSDSDSDKKVPERPDFNSLKHPDIFSKYEVTSPFQDFHCTPIELINKVFNREERKIINLDPIFFRLNKEPFHGVQKNLRFCLKDKLNEEDRMLKQKIKLAKERNKKLRLNYLRKKKDEKNFFPKKVIKGYLAETNKNENNEGNISKENNKSDNIDIKKSNSIENYSKSIKNRYTQINSNNNEFNKRKRIFKVKENKTLSSNINKIKNKDKNDANKTNLYIKTDDNENLENYDKKAVTINYPISMPPYYDDEKMSDKKKRLTMQQIFDLYIEKKKLYNEDVVYNRTKDIIKYEKLRIENYQNIQKEKEKKENLRKITASIAQNYKLLRKKNYKI